MQKIMQVCMVAMGLILSSLAHSHDYAAGDLKIGHPWARATPPGAKAAGAFLVIENKGKSPDKLVRAASPVAGAVELHTMRMEGNVMRMRAVDVIDVRAGSTVKLEPGGWHVMLLDLKAPLKKGERVPITLTFERAGEVKVELAVEDMAASPKDAHAGHGAAQGSHSGHAGHGSHGK